MTKPCSSPSARRRSSGLTATGHSGQPSPRNSPARPGCAAAPRAGCRASPASRRARRRCGRAGARGRAGRRSAPGRRAAARRRRARRRAPRRAGRWRRRPRRPPPRAGRRGWPSSARSRRFARRWRSASRSARARLASRNARSLALSSRVVRAGPVERRGEPGAAVELARVAPGRLPVAGGGDQVRVQPAPLRVLLEPAAQPRPLAQQRLVGDLDAPLADRDEALSASTRQRSADAVAARARPAARGGARRPSPSPSASRSSIAPRDRAARSSSSRSYARSASRATAPRTPPAALVGGQAQPAAVAPLPQLQQRGRQQRQRPGSPLDVGHERVGELRLDVAARRARAGSSIARRSSSRRIGPTSTWLAPIRRDSSG